MGRAKQFALSGARETLGMSLLEPNPARFHSEGTANASQVETGLVWRLPREDKAKGRQRGEGECLAESLGDRLGTAWDDLTCMKTSSLNVAGLADRWEDAWLKHHITCKAWLCG